jgi:magnesium transporter
MNARTGTNLNDPVTRHMRTDFTPIRVNHAVGEAMAYLRQHPPEGPVVYFYAVDDDNRLRGVVPTRRLVLSAPETPIADIMVPQVVVLPAEATVLDACEFFIQHRLLAFPVVDAERRLLGLVDVSLYTKEISDLERRKGSDHLFQLIGVHLTEAQQASAALAFRSRFPWLVCNITAGLIAAFLSGIYQEELAWGGAVLAFFIPVVLALAESVSIQSLSLAIETLHGQRPTWSALATKLRRELLTGVFLGAASGVVVALVALVWLGEARVALCLLGGIGGGVAAAALIGLALPNVLRLLRRDPNVASGPIALAGADMVTLLVYFNLARALLNA